MKKHAAASCGLARALYTNVVMAHGGGGRLMHRLIDDVFLGAFGKPDAPPHDGALLDAGNGRIAFTTDSYVVQPLFFPGGDIGTLAVNGTVNDLAMCGARPRWLSAGFIIEEGLAVDSLERIAQSMASAARAASVSLVTGDTKVVERGKGDGVFINTAGIGILEHDLFISPLSVRVGDAVILSGDVGRHGMAIMASREGLSFESSIRSDCAELATCVLDLLGRGIHVHCMRDLTRGGLATSLVEIAEASRTRISIDESQVEVERDVASACEILGLSPMYVANEGRFVAIVPPDQADRALDVMHGHPVCERATLAGVVEDGHSPVVILRSRLGTRRVLDMLSGEQLPRIC